MTKSNNNNLKRKNHTTNVSFKILEFCMTNDWKAWGEDFRSDSSMGDHDIKRLEIACLQST